VVYGDAAKREVLMAAGLMRAKALVVSYKDKHSALAILRHVKELRPDLPVVVRTTDDTHVEALKEAGAAEVVAEVPEGSVSWPRKPCYGAAESRDLPRPESARAAMRCSAAICAHYNTKSVRQPTVCSVFERVALLKIRR
jgi:hypothetical protein